MFFKEILNEKQNCIAWLYMSSRVCYIKEKPYWYDRAHSDMLFQPYRMYFDLLHFGRGCCETYWTGRQHNWPMLASFITAQNIQMFWTWQMHHLHAVKGHAYSGDSRRRITAAVFIRRGETSKAPSRTTPHIYGV